MEKSDIHTELVQLCNLAITLLAKAKDNGLLTTDEYNAHIKLKKDFLELYNNNSK